MKYVVRVAPPSNDQRPEGDCADSYIGLLMNWLDVRHASYMAWSWNANFSCTAGPSLITSYAGTPTRYGAGYRAHLRSLR
jgi:endoglucanase